jgi:hypothetical protein
VFVCACTNMHFVVFFGGRNTFSKIKLIFVHFNSSRFPVHSTNSYYVSVYGKIRKMYKCMNTTSFPFGRRHANHSFPRIRNFTRTLNATTHENGIFIKMQNRAPIKCIGWYVVRCRTDRSSIHLTHFRPTSAGSGQSLPIRSNLPHQHCTHSTRFESSCHHNVE